MVVYNKNVKVAFKITLFASFLLVAVFGFAAMGHTSAHCIVSTMQGAACPENLFGFASFHISFFKNFSSAVFDGLGLLALFALAVFLAAHLTFQKEIFSTSFSSFRIVSEIGGHLTEKLRSWLSLLETSPTFSPVR